MTGSSLLGKALVASALLSSLALAAPTSSAATSTSSSASSNYKLVADYSGTSFFDGWDFFTGADPTNGYVSYQSEQDALQKNLAGFISHSGANASSSAYMGVDYKTNLTGSTASGRDSIRISTNATFSGGGLFIADINHMPIGTACGSWPALWLLGTAGTWPASGEVDILEGVNMDTMNQVTLHTESGCSTNNASTSMLGDLSETYCGPSSANTGCGIVAPSTAELAFSRNETCSHATAGKAFNKANGAVYATLWNDEGISVYMFPHEYVPSDISSGSPDPSTWTVKPLAKFGGNSCDFMEKFYDLQLVIDTTFCGSWAGEQFNVSNVEGQEACSVSTGYATCEAYVAAHPEAFRETYWDVASIRVYQTTVNNTYSDSTRGAAKRAVELPVIDVGEEMADENGTKSSGGERHSHGHGHGEFGAPMLNASQADSNSSTPSLGSPFLGQQLNATDNANCTNGTHHRQQPPFSAPIPLNDTTNCTNATHPHHHHHHGGQQPPFLIVPVPLNQSTADNESFPGAMPILPRSEVALKEMVKASGSAASKDDASVLAWAFAAGCALVVAAYL